MPHPTCLRALQGLVDFAKVLVANNVQLLSTGGTAKAIRDAGLPVTDVSEFTGSPEVMDGRVKTLHPRVHGGILMRDTDSDRAELLQLGGEPIDLVVVNLYPFSATVAKGAPFADCIENIDIGGPTMVRAAAKNHNRVTVVVEPADYDEVAKPNPNPNPNLDPNPSPSPSPHPHPHPHPHPNPNEVAATLPGGGPDQALRAKLALKAFCHTSCYDTTIAEWMQGQLGDRRMAVHTLKYGCDPRQKLGLGLG